MTPNGEDRSASRFFYRKCSAVNIFSLMGSCAYAGYRLTRKRYRTCWFRLLSDWLNDLFFWNQLLKQLVANASLKFDHNVSGFRQLLGQCDTLKQFKLGNYRQVYSVNGRKKADYPILVIRRNISRYLCGCMACRCVTGRCMAGRCMAGWCMAGRAMADCTERCLTFYFSGLQHDITSFP